MILLYILNVELFTHLHKKLSEIPKFPREIPEFPKPALERVKL